MKVLPENILKCMSAKDRKAIGQCTAAEAMAKWEYENEKALHKDIIKLLNRKGIVFFHSRMDKKTRRKKGEPDFLFSVRQPGPIPIQIAIAWEVKTEKGRLSLEQERLIDRMIQPPNGWRVKVIRSLQEAIKELAELGV